MMIIALIPVFNSASRIGELVKACFSLGLRVLVVSDGSTDGSENEALKAGAAVLDFRRRRGKNAALRSGFEYIEKEYSGADAVLAIDDAAGCGPDDIRRILDASAKGAGVVVGAPGRTLDDAPLRQIIAARVISRVSERIFGLRISDVFFPLFLIPVEVFRLVLRRKSRAGLNINILLAAVRQGLGISEVRVSCRGKFASSSETFYAAAPLFYEYVRKGHALPLLKFAFPAIVLVVFSWLFMVQVGKVTKDIAKPAFRPGVSGALAEERALALQWLKKHSPEDAVIIADQFDGNYIVALANRRVVSSSKVYPSEAKEVAARYTDIAKFFFSTDEREALEIAKRYEVDYVFYGEDPAYRANCELANACHFLSGGKLTLLGKRLTIIGRFESREPFEHFELLWDSPNFSIYRIKGGRGERNPCRLTQLEKEDAIRIARGEYKPDVLPQLCGAAVSLFDDGASAISNGVGWGRSLAEVIWNAARGLGDERDASRFKIQIAVFGPDERVPRSIRDILERGVDPEKIYFFSPDGSQTVFFPEFLNRRGYENTQEMLEALCEKSGLRRECWQDRNARLEVAPAQIFMEDRFGRPVDIAGTVPLLEEVLEFDERVLRDRLLMARNWIWRMRAPDGNFYNEINPHRPEYKKEDARLASLHGAAETWWLLEYHLAVPRPGVVEFGRSQSARFDRLIFSGEEQRTAFLIYAGLENLSLWRVTGERQYLERAIQYALLQASLFADEKNLARSFRAIGDGAEITDKSSAGSIANGSGLYFLSQAALAGKNERLRDASIKFAQALKKDFRHRRILDPDISIVWESWLVNAFAKVAELSESKEDAEFSLEVARWVLDYQSRDELFHLRGAFRGKAATSGIGKITEALIEAAMVAERLGYDYDKELFMNGFREAMRWLMMAQYTRDSHFLSDKNRAEMSGAIRSSINDITAEIDNAGHFMLAGAWYLIYESR